MENEMHQRTMLDQPKTAWMCECGGSKGFDILLCPECKGHESHIIGFECRACKAIHMTLTANPQTYAEDEDVIH